jgi:DNA end-binding protein Ku
MAPRPYWKGYLKLSLVSCAVALYPASTKSERISFHWLNRETGNRLRQQMVDGETGEPVDREDRVRGYQVAKNDYLMIEDDEFDAVEIESSHTIDIDSFIPRSDIDPVFLDNSHYLVPDDKVAEEAFAVIREAMAAEDVVGIGRAVMARRERLLLLEPRGKGILSTVLHYNYEVRDDDTYFRDIPDIRISGEMLDLAKHIIKTKLGHFDPSRFEDRYENALIEMVRAKQAGRPADLPKPEQPRNVVNLMEALRNSIAAEKAGLRKSNLNEEDDERPAAREAGSRAKRESPPRIRNAAASRPEPRRTDDQPAPRRSASRARTRRP